MTRRRTSPRRSRAAGASPTTRRCFEVFVIADNCTDGTAARRPRRRGRRWSSGPTRRGGARATPCEYFFDRPPRPAARGRLRRGRRDRRRHGRRPGHPGRLRRGDRRRGRLGPVLLHGEQPRRLVADPAPDLCLQPVQRRLAAGAGPDGPGRRPEGQRDVLREPGAGAAALEGVRADRGPGILLEAPPGRRDGPLPARDPRPGRDGQPLGGGRRVAAAALGGGPEVPPRTSSSGPCCGRPGSGRPARSPTSSSSSSPPRDAPARPGRGGHGPRRALARPDGSPPSRDGSCPSMS